MFIDCYLLSKMARKIDHVYYTSYDYMFGEFFYFDLGLCNLDNIRFNTYPYKVRIDSNDVFYIDKKGLRALKFQIVEEVNILDWIEASSLKDRIKSYLKSICKGSVPQDKILEFYNKTIINPTALLTTAQIFKLHAILSQKKYELPTRVITNGNKSYLRAYEFYGREYEFDSNHKPFFKTFEAEASLGSKTFEYIENEDTEILMSDVSSFLKLVASRKLTQNQFEYMFHEERTIYYGSHAIAAGYKILPKYKRHFYPYLIYSDPEMALELLNKRNLTRTEVNYFYEKNYKIGNYNFSSDKVKETKSIFLKDEDYKYIEVAT